MQWLKKLFDRSDGWTPKYRWSTILYYTGTPIFWEGPKVHHDVAVTVYFEINKEGKRRCRFEMPSDVDRQYLESQTMVRYDLHQWIDQGKKPWRVAAYMVEL